MGKKIQKVDDYITNAADFAKPILAHLRELIHITCPDVEEDWKWSFPVFIYQGGIMCNMAAFKKHCAFGFWKGALIADEDHILEITEKEAMGQLGKITSLEDLPPGDILIKYIQSAMKLNEEGKSVPRTKPTGKEKMELITPTYLMEALLQNEKAKINFEAFPYSHKKEYIQWLEDAKTEPTKLKRLHQAVEWIGEGKDRNWKYKNC